jgi:hypothetical protein
MSYQPGPLTGHPVRPAHRHGREGGAEVDRCRLAPLWRLSWRSLCSR